MNQDESIKSYQIPGHTLLFWANQFSNINDKPVKSLSPFTHN